MREVFCEKLKWMESP